jgi:sulfur carrier protein
MSEEEKPRRVAVQVNGSCLELAAGTTLLDLVGLLGCGTRGVALALNSQLLPKAQWREVTLVGGECVEVLHAVAGG